MKKLLIMLAMVLALSFAAHADEMGCDNPHNPHYPCDDEEDDNGDNGNGGGNGGGGPSSSAVSDASATSDASAASSSTAYGTGVGVGIGEGGDASATGGSAAGYGGDAYSAGGDASASSGVRGSGNASNSTSVSTSFNYEVAAAAAATLITGVCQDGTSVQGVKFGLSAVSQSVFCMHTTIAQLSLNASYTMQCGAEDYDCLGDKEFLREKAVRELNAAAISIGERERKGVLKVLFGLVW